MGTRLTKLLSDDFCSCTCYISIMQAECKKRKRDRCVRTIEDLTISLHLARRQWIREEQPPVYEVIERYPSLKIKKVVCYIASKNLHCHACFLLRWRRCMESRECMQGVQFRFA